MLFQNFQSYQPVFEILLICIVAGIIGYLFHYILSRKKWDYRFRAFENKMSYYEDKLRDLESIKDKQGLLFKSTNDMTLKINEFDALLGLNGKVDDISKTLNSLNFVSTKEFNNYINDFNSEYYDYKGEVDARFNTLNFDTQFDDLSKSIKLNFETMKQEFEQNIESNNSRAEQSFLEVDRKNKEKVEEIYQKIDSLKSDQMEALLVLQKQLEESPWENHFNDVSTLLTSNHESFLDFKSSLSDYTQFRDEFQSSKEKLNAHEDKWAEFSKLKNTFNSLETDFSDLKSNQSFNKQEISGLRSEFEKAVQTSGNFSTRIEQYHFDFLNLQKNFESKKSVLNQHEDAHINFKRKLSEIEGLIRQNSGSLQSLEAVNDKLNSMQKRINEHKHQEYDHSKLENNFQSFTTQCEEKFKQLNSFDSYRTELADLKDNQHKLFDSTTQHGESLKNLLNKVSQEGKKNSAVVKINTQVKSRSTNKLVDKLSIKDIKASARDKDDLKLIKGVGPFIEKKINKLGIYTFEQIGGLKKSDINLITEAIEFFPGRISRDNWKGQAKKLLKKKKAS